MSTRSWVMVPKPSAVHSKLPGESGTGFWDTGSPSTLDIVCSGKTVK